MAVSFMSLSSGSCGNCYFLSYKDESGHSHGLVIDAGVSLRCMKRDLESEGYGYDSFSFVLITHDHMDHIRNLASYCKRLQKPVYATSTLHEAMARHFTTRFRVPFCRKDLSGGVWNEIDGFRVRYFIVPHDATQTVGYAIMAGNHKFVIITDIGHMTEEAVSFASQADTVVVESNYDVDMLLAGNYSQELKMRICQGNGHLSNDECANAVKHFYHPELKQIFLCHLSENNNTPEKAYETTLSALRDIGVEPGEILLQTLPRKSKSLLYHL